MKQKNEGRVVLVDSSRRLLKLLKCALEEGPAALSCTCVQSAQTAFQYLQSGARAELLVVDCMLEDMDILTFMRNLHQRFPKRRFHVIVSGPTQYSGALRTKLLSIGVDYYIIKPYTADDLLESLDMVKMENGLAFRTPWDGYVLRYMKTLPLHKKNSGYWCTGSCLQSWLTCKTQPPQLKEIYINVGKQLGISAKGVESGVHRTTLELCQQGYITQDVSNKSLIEALASSIRLKFEQESQEQSHATEEWRIGTGLGAQT